jgi:hypothetical protein
MSSGLSSKSAPSTTYGSIDFAIYLSIGVVQIYENGGFKGSYTSSLIDGGIYKVQRTGNTITYLVNDVVSLKLIYPSPFILSVEKVPLPPHALLVLIVVRVLPLSVRFTNALLSLSLLGAV